MLGILDVKLLGVVSCWSLRVLLVVQEADGHECEEDLKACPDSSQKCGPLSFTLSSVEHVGANNRVPRKLD